MYFKLTDLIGWGKADARIHLDALKDGVSLNDLEKQLLTRNELFEFDILRDLRLPQLIEMIESWGRTPAEYNVEDIVADIETRKPNRKLIIEVAKSSSFANSYEADIFLEEEQDGEWQRIPSTYPGFIVAKNKAEKTIDTEIKRTSQFLEKRYLPDLVEREFAPAEYNIEKIKATNIRTEQDRTFADIEVEIGKSKPGIKYDSAHEYWEKVVAPTIMSEHASPAQKRIQIAHYMKNLAQAYAGQIGQQNLQKINRTMNILKRMLETQMLVGKSYSKIFTEIESDDARINGNSSIEVNGLLEKLADDKTLEKLWDHDNANLFYTEGFKFNLKNASIKI